MPSPSSHAWIQGCFPETPAKALRIEFAARFFRGIFGSFVSSQCCGVFLRGLNLGGHIECWELPIFERVLYFGGPRAQLAHGAEALQANTAQPLLKAEEERRAGRVGHTVVPLL